MFGSVRMYIYMYICICVYVTKKPPVLYLARHKPSKKACIMLALNVYMLPKMPLIVGEASIECQI